MRSKLELARGTAMLVGEGLVGGVHVVEGVHRAVTGAVSRLHPGADLVGRISGLVYSSVRGTGGAIAASLGFSLRTIEQLTGGEAAGSAPDPNLQVWLSALNGALGDHLERTGNPLALDMALSHNGRALSLRAPDLQSALPDARPRLVVFVHGLGLSPLHWRAGNAPSFGQRLEDDLGCTALDLHYNTGRHISASGRALAHQLQTLVATYPVPVHSITLIGHSMGGLVCRSACHYARQERCSWVEKVTDVVCLGSPHQGAPLERVGNWVTLVLGLSPYTAPFSWVGKTRSAGVRDLRHGSVCDEDWRGREPDEMMQPRTRPAPLLPHIRYFFAAATVAANPGDSRSRWLGDGLVPVPSALGQHPDPRLHLQLPPARCRVFPRMSHMQLLYRPEVYAQLLRWLEPQPQLLSSGD